MIKPISSNLLRADYVIIGAGTAGCLLANRLSSDSSNNVILLEAGSSDNNPLVNVPAGYLYSMKSPRTSWQYKTTNQQGLSGRKIDYPRGKVLGGCSSINGMIFMTGTKRDYDKWCFDYNNKGWNADDLRPLFQKFVRFELNNSLIGQVWGENLEASPLNSNFKVQNQRLHWDLLDDFSKACSEKNIPFTNNFNNSEVESCGYFQVNQSSGLRVNSNKAFIEPIKQRLSRNLHVLTNSKVSKILLDENNKAYGIEYKTNSGVVQTLIAEKEVILSAGSINNPQILMLSGIGDPNQLLRHGIDVRVPSKNVGKNLQDHLQIRTVFRLKEGSTTLNTMYHSLMGKLSIGWNYLYDRSGPLSMAPSQFGLFTKSSKYEYCNLQFHVQPLSLDQFGEPLHRFPGLTLSVCNLKPTSRGEVRLSSNNCDDSPEIDPKYNFLPFYLYSYLATDEDLEVAAESIKISRSFANAQALAKYQPHEYFPGKHIESDKDLSMAAGKISSSIFHPVGSCRMSDDDDGVVNSSLQVKGVKNLRIIDASIMPEITSGNTNTPTLLIAEKGADLIKKSEGTLRSHFNPC